VQLFNTLTWLYRVSKLCFPEFVHQFIDQKRSKMTKKWTKTIKNDLTSHTQLHEPVRSFYLLTHIFGTIRDCTHDDNAAILECLSIGMKKDTRRERKNVTAVLNFYFFIFENLDKNTSDLPGAIVEYLKCFNGPLFSARFEIVHTTTTLQRLSEWFEEIKKLEGPMSRWHSWLLRKFFFQKKNLANIILEKIVFWQTTSEHHSPSCCILNVSIYKHFWHDLRLHTLQQCCNVWWDD